MKEDTGAFCRSQVRPPSPEWKMEPLMPTAHTLSASPKATRRKPMQVSWALGVQVWPPSVVL